MRISTDPDDRGHALYQSVKDLGFVVFLDGIEIPSETVITADDKEHVLVTKLMRPDGSQAIFDMEPVEITHRGGHVLIALKV